MEIIRVKNAEEGGKKAFEIIKEGMNKGAKVLGLATGSTPVTLYKEMTSSDLDFSEMTSVNLDEYVGLGGSDEQSYRHFMDVQLFDKKPFKETFVPDGKAEDVPTKAVSMGIGSIMKSKEIVLMAFGESKADAIKGMIEGPVTNHLPASVLQNHDNVVVIIDEEAASKL